MGNNMNEKNKSTNYKSIIFLVIIILLVLTFIKSVMINVGDNTNELKDIKSIKKVLSTKYDNIRCVSKKCDYVIGTVGNGLGKTTYNIFNMDGKKVAYYKVDYSKKESKMTDIYAASDNYIITRTLINNVYFYVLRNNKGKEKYSSNSKMVAVNNNLIMVQDNDIYKLLDKKGRIVVNNIKQYEEYVDGKFVSIISKNDKFIVGEKGNRMLDNHIISRQITDKSFIVQNTKTNLYNYFDVNKNKKIGKSFNSYSLDSENNIIIYRTSNNEKYILKNNGKQIKSNSNFYENIIKNIDSEKYYVYQSGIKNQNQKYVVANNKSDKSLGILNVKTKKFSKLYKYSNDENILNSTVSDIKNDKNVIVRITCLKEYCGENKNIIYNLTSNKKIYSEAKKDVTISDFILYDNGYKVIKYSSVSSNQDYEGKSVLYDKNNKELENNRYDIVIVDNEIKIGNIGSGRVILYSSKNKKKINEIDSLASKLMVNDKVFFKYKKNNNAIFYKLNYGKVFEISQDDYALYTNNYIVYTSDNKIYMYNTQKNKTKKYRLKNNESMSNESGELINPYRGLIVINNNSSNKIKALSCKGSTIKYIQNSQLSETKKAENGRLLLIVKNGKKYGLFVTD